MIAAKPSLWEDLAGGRYMFDYGLNARFLLEFSHHGTVDITALVGVVYSISTVDTFPVDVERQGDGLYEIGWQNPNDQTRLTHTANFGLAHTTVVIVDDRLRETRRFAGAISLA